MQLCLDHHLDRRSSPDPAQSETTVSDEPTRAEDRGSLEVPAVGAITPDPGGGWEAFGDFGEYRGPLTATDKRLLPPVDGAYSLLGLGLLNRQVR